MNIKTLKWLGTFFCTSWNTFNKFKFLSYKYFFSWIWGLCVDFSWLLI